MPEDETEIRALLSLAAPLIGTQLAVVAIAWTDALVMAQLGPTSLAGGGLGATLLSMMTIIVSCILGGLSSMVARAIAGGRLSEARALIEQARLLAFLCAVPSVILVTFSEDILLMLGQGPEVADEAARYLLGAAPALIALPLGVVQRHAFAALRRPKLVTLAWLLAVPTNAVLDFALAFGAGTSDGFGVAGVGIATTAVSLLIVGVLELALRRSEPSLAGRWIVRPAAPTLRSIAALGLPIALAVGAEVGVFSAAAVVIGVFGSASLAAHQVAIQTTQLLFMVPNGLAQAASIRVASRAPRAAQTALTLAVAGSAPLALAMLAARPLIVGLYFTDAASPEARIASSLLACVAALHVADALQVVAAGVLRGRLDTRTAMRWGIVSYVFVAPIVGLTFGFAAELGALGIWAGLAAALWVAAAALVDRMRGADE